MPFSNRVRLPLELTRPQFPTEKNAYRLANGSTKTRSVVIHKVYQGDTDWLPEGTHEKIQTALSHDHVYIEGEKYIGEIDADSGYNIEWQDRGSYPTAPAKFKAEVTPFNATNSNCMTCEEAIQVVTVDDNLGTIVEGATKSQDVSANDSICCYPVSFSIRYYNPAIVASATIDPDGTAHITLKTPLADGLHVKLATYRAECSAGQYDDADIYADIDGSLASCLQPTGLGAFFLTPTHATLIWTPPTPYFAGSYHYQIFATSNPGLAIHEGDTTDPSIVFTDLEQATNYIFYVKSVCAPGQESDYVSEIFNTQSLYPGPGHPGICGTYMVMYTDPYGGTGFTDITYVGCDGNSHLGTLINGVPVYICALESSPGVYVGIHIMTSYYQQTIQYQGPC